MRDGLVDGVFGRFEGVRGAVVAIDALHLEDGQGRGRFGLGAGGEIRSRRAGSAVLHPRNGLALFVGGGVADVDAGAHVRSVNAARGAAADQHHQNGFGARIGFIVLEMMR